MRQQSRPTRTAPPSGRTAMRRIRSVVAAGALAAALIAAAAPAASASTDSQVGVTSDLYPAVREMKGVIESLYSFTPFTANATSQTGGYWNNSAIDTSTMRGITSGHLGQQLRSSGPYATCDPLSSNNCAGGPLHIDAFFGDQDDVDAVIPASDGGTCVASVGVECNGLVSSKHAVAIGSLVIYSCSGRWAGSTKGDDPSNGGTPRLAFGADVTGSGNGKPQSTRCDAAPIPGGGPATIPGVVTWLATSGHRVAVADPATDPYGAASKQALIQNGFTWTADGPGQNVFIGSACDIAGTACKVRLEAGTSQVRGAVTANAGGNTQLGLVAKSNIVRVNWTSGPRSGTTGYDPNTWSTVDPRAYSGYGDIELYAVSLTGGNRGASDAWDALLNNNWDSHTTIQRILASYGY
ncbi:hypothetical protein [Streptomyces sp. NBC_00083]|uniref:hypothetical protein n=1 Tax=Streptomyces sp. NBC_00083 TaxID=2975647 RepID=UPI002250D335|nr:hypothetical protein [Streptomyces sp. NBC_00083]MCX5387879.1 hypothetical protein [Streptomyces sp. NBC_00083]